MQGKVILGTLIGGLLLMALLTTKQLTRLHAAFLSNLGYVGLLEYLPAHVSSDGFSFLEEDAGPLGELPGLAQQFPLAVALNPNSQSAHYGLAFLSMLNHNYSRAIDHMEQSDCRTELDSIWLVWAYWKANHLEELLARYTSDQLGAQLRVMAWHLLLTDRREPAVSTYELATFVNPYSVDLWLDRIGVYANEWGKARAAYSKAAQIFPDEPYLKLVGAYLAWYGGAGGYRVARGLADDVASSMKNMESEPLEHTRVYWLQNGFKLLADLARVEGNQQEVARWTKRGSLLEEDWRARATPETFVFRTICVR